jgi:hypothetical protein
MSVTRPADREVLADLLQPARAAVASPDATPDAADTSAQAAA